MKNITLTRVSVFTLITLLLSGCGLNAVKPEVKKQIKSTEIHVIVKQPEIYAVLERQAAGNNMLGLLTLATSGDRQNFRKERAQKAIKPITKAMRGYNVPSLAQKVFDKGLKTVTWMNPSKVKLVKRELSLDERYQITRKSKADAVLFVELEYRLTNTFQGIEILSNTSMYRETNKDPAASPDVIYRNMHTYKWDLPNKADGVSDRNELGKKWSEKKAAVLKEKIQEGLDVEAKQLVKELQKS